MSTRTVYMGRIRHTLPPTLANSVEVKPSRRTPRSPRRRTRLLKQIQDPLEATGSRHPGRGESGLAEPFKKNNESASTNGANKADDADHVPAKKPPSRNTRDLTHSVWYPHEGIVQPTKCVSGNLNLIAPDGGVVLTMSISIGKVTIGENGLTQGP